MSSEPTHQQPSTGVRGFAHVGIIVPELETATTLFRDRLGVQVTGPEEEPELGLRILWVRAGGVLLEFVAPAREDSRARGARPACTTSPSRSRAWTHCWTSSPPPACRCATEPRDPDHTAVASRSWIPRPAAGP